MLSPSHAHAGVSALLSARVRQDPLFSLQVIWLSIIMVVARLVLPLAEGDSDENLQALFTWLLHAQRSSAPRFASALNPHAYHSC